MDIPDRTEPSKEQLASEIATVEKILRLAQHDETLDEADDIVIKFMMSTPSYYFDDITLNEYVAYLLDERIEIRKGQFAEAQETRQSAGYFLKDIEAELKNARQRLASLD